MSFSEKLQSLRKINKMSQEQLADMLDVTRQSVSKWESGQTYPEMDKLLAMCKIFKCSLDDLTNDEVTDVKIENKKRNNISNFIDGTLDLIKRTYDMFKTMKGKQVTQCLSTMLIVALILMLFRLPFDGIETAFYNIISALGNGTATSFVSGIFNLLLDICYYVLYILIFVYIFKIGFLDRYEVEVEEDVKVEESSKESESKEDVKPRGVVTNNNRSYTVFNTLGVIAIFFIKIMVCFFAFPFIISLLMLCAGLLITIILLFKGVFYLGVLFGLAFAILLNVIIVEVIFNFLFNRKNNPKRLVITFLISIIGLGLSFGLFMFDMANTTYIDKAPENIKHEIISKDIVMKDDLYFAEHYNIEYVVDNNLTDKVKMEVTYYPDYGKVWFSDEETGIILTSDAPEQVIGKNYVDLIVKNLANKKIYNYDSLFSLKTKVITSEENITKIKDNLHKHNQQEEASYNNSQIEFYQNQITDYEEQIRELRESNGELKNEVNELKTKIDEYKNNFKSLLNE